MRRNSVAAGFWLPLDTKQKHILWNILEVRNTYPSTKSQCVCFFNLKNPVVFWSQKHHGASEICHDLHFCQDFQAVLPLLLELGKLGYPGPDASAPGCYASFSHGFIFLIPKLSWLLVFFVKENEEGVL